MGTCAPLLEPIGEAVDQAVPERLDRDKAWAVGNRAKHRAVPFAEDGASLPCCHVGHSRHGYCAVQHMAMNLVAASTKKARVRMAVMPEPSASRPIPASGSGSFVLTIVVDGIIPQ